MKVCCFAAALVVLPPFATTAMGSRSDTVPYEIFGGCVPYLSLNETLEKQIHSCSIMMHSPYAGTRPTPPPEELADIDYTRGQLYHLAGKYELAVGDYTNAIALRSNYNFYESRGDAYEDLGQHDKASADYAQAAAMRGDDPAAQVVQCEIRGVRGHPLNRGLTDCTKALSATTDGQYLLDMRCLVYFRMANYQAAIADCAKARAMRARDPAALYVEGVAKLRLADQGGKADIAAAIDADYHVADGYALYGIKP